jgi:hypothetical protein
MPNLLLGPPIAGVDPPPAALVVDRQIDPRTMDYARDSSGLHSEADSVSMRVLLVLGQIRGALPYEPDFGDSSKDLSKETLDVRNVIYSAVRIALQDMITAGEVELIDVEVISKPGRMARLVKWRKTGSIAVQATGI